MKYFLKGLRVFLTSLSLSLLIASSAQAGSSSLDLSQYKGKAVYLDFWASWCTPCKKSFPWMEKMQAKYGGQGLQIVAVTVDENPADVDHFLRKFPDNKLAIIRDPKGKIADQYQLKGMPTAILFDTAGNEVGRHIGFRSAREHDYEGSIRAILPRSRERR